MDINKLLPPVLDLRPTNPDGPIMELLRDSIIRDGLLNPVSVNQDLIIVDGFRRLLICRELGWKDIPVHQVDGDPLDLRVISNTLTFDERRALVGRLLLENADVTATEIARRFGWFPHEVEQLVCWHHLIPEFKEQGIRLSTVWHVSRLKIDAQRYLFDCNLSPDELHAAAEEALRGERAVRYKETYAKTKRYKLILREHENPRFAGPLIIKHKAETPLDGWNLAIKWILDLL